MWCQVLQCHVQLFTEDVLFLKQYENKPAKTPQGLISKADGIKALIFHTEEGRGGRISISGLEKRICNCRASLQKTNTIKMFTARRVVHLGDLLNVRDSLWRTELRCELCFSCPGTVGCFPKNEGRSFHFSGFRSTDSVSQFSCFSVHTHFQTSDHLRKETASIPAFAPPRIKPQWQIYLKLEIATKSKT